MELNYHINITLNLQTINKDDEIELEVNGTIISYKNKKYIITVHQGYPIKSIIIDNIIYTDFIICSWCDLMILSIDNYLQNLFVFKQFVKKQIEPTDKYFINNHKLKFINYQFMELKMIPNNPLIMYNCFEINNINNNIIIAGQPIYNEKNKLVGIVSKIDTETNNIYSVPINYILTALNKHDNTKIYSLDEDINNINKLNNYKVICDKIYCSLHKMYIPIDTYILVNTDSFTNYNILLNNGRIKKANIIEINNNYYNYYYNNNLIINNNIITLTSGFIHLLKILDEGDLIEEILTNKKYNDFTIQEI